ncbi:MAG: hypothetical protein ACRDU0_09305, partial [Mycobacterium sp.]
LVARVGLLSEDILVESLTTLQEMVGPRVIAGIGSGDSLSAPENRAYGVEFAPVSERRALLSRCCGRLRDAGVTTWVGAGAGGAAPATLAMAVETGAALNLWEASPEQVASQANLCEVTWGGRLDTRTDTATGTGSKPPQPEKALSELATAGARWAVCAWPGSPEELAEVVAGSNRRQ